jgi:hypothetical protein
MSAVPWLAAATAHTFARRANRPPRQSDKPYAAAEHRESATTIKGGQEG